jgi:predicted nucleic acid binding AN1-type Zn finger protein
MELTTVTKINVEDPRVTIIINPENSETSVKLSYTCNECGGRGCNQFQQRNRECNQGTVYKSLDIKDLRSNSTNDQMNSIVASAIQNLYNKIFKI